MTQQKAAELVEANLPALYGYAYEKLFNKDKAEDLCHEIVLEILKSANRLKNDKAFWSFAWKIAENTFRKTIRREKIREQCVSPLTEEMGNIIAEPETEEETDETLYRLRRELALLSRTHREVCVLYYVENKSCSSIAKELQISVEAVKGHLFKARNLLKEGLKMERKIGEKSYNPGTFRLDFWGSENHYNSRFDKKLSGAILLAAYEQPMRLEELSLELGVAMPYLEEEAEVLETAGLLAKQGKKYQTNIVIIKKAYEEALKKETESIYPEVASAVYEKVRSALPAIRALNFHGSDYAENRLIIGLLNIVFVRGYIKARSISPIANPPKLPLGGWGYLFGFDNDFENNHFSGICMEVWNKEKTAWFSAENYKALRKAQFYDHSAFWVKAEAMCDAILEKEANTENKTLPWLIENGFILSENGKLAPNFLVFEEKVFYKILDILSEPIGLVADAMIRVSETAEKLLRETAPAAVKAQCGDVAKIHHRLNVAGCLMEALLQSGSITVPEERTPACVFGIR